MSELMSLHDGHKWTGVEGGGLLCLDCSVFMHTSADERRWKANPQLLSKPGPPMRFPIRSVRYPTPTRSRLK